MGSFKRKRLVVAVALLLFTGGLLAVLFWPRPDELARWKAGKRAQGENFTLMEIAPKFSVEKQQFVKQLKSAVNGLLAYPVHPSAIDVMKTNAPGQARIAWRQPFASETSRTNVPWSALADQVADSDKSLGRLHELLRTVPPGSPCDYSDPANLGGGDLVAIRKAAQYLTLAAVSDLHRGALDSALTHLHTLIALASLHEEEGSLVFQMVRAAVTGLGVGTTWEALQAPGWDDTRLAALEAAWARVELLKRMPLAFEVERAWAVALYQIARTNDGGPSGILGGASGGAKQVFEDNVYTPLWQKAWSKTDELLYLRAMQPFGEAIRLGVTNRSWQAMADRLRGVGDFALTNRTALDRFRYQFADSAIPNWGKASKVLMRHETHIQMARAAIAIQRHRLRHGRAPTALAELVPGFLRETPVDYMTSRPLNYKVNADGSSVMYSSGENGRDDGGLGDDMPWPQPSLPVGKN